MDFSVESHDFLMFNGSLRFLTNKKLWLLGYNVKTVY